MSTDTKKKRERKQILIIGGVLVFIGMLFPNPTDFWNGSITGMTVKLIAEPIYNNLASQAVDVGECIDRRDGSLDNYNAFQAAIGNLRCED